MEGLGKVQDPGAELPTPPLACRDRLSAGMGTPFAGTSLLLGISVWEQPLNFCSQQKQTLRKSTRCSDKTLCVQLHAKAQKALIYSKGREKTIFWEHDWGWKGYSVPKWLSRYFCPHTSGHVERAQTTRGRMRICCARKSFWGRDGQCPSVLYDWAAFSFGASPHSHQQFQIPNLGFFSASELPLAPMPYQSALPGTIVNEDGS